VAKSSKSRIPVFRDHNLCSMDPMSAQEQFKPTEATPIRMHKQMAGDPMGGGMIPSVAASGIAPLRGGIPSTGASIGTVAGKPAGGPARRFVGSPPVAGPILNPRPPLKHL
jgi:hypothetical protein